MKTPSEFGRGNRFQRKLAVMSFHILLIFVQTVDLFQLMLHLSLNWFTKSGPRVFGTRQKWRSLFTGHIATDRKVLMAAATVTTFPHT
jgi:hypothetical protein